MHRSLIGENPALRTIARAGCVHATYRVEKFKMITLSGSPTWMSDGIAKVQGWRHQFKPVPGWRRFSPVSPETVGVNNLHSAITRSAGWGGVSLDHRHLW